MTDDWLQRIKGTMAIDIERGGSARKSGPEIVEMLFAIPEVSQAFHLRANRRRPLAVDPATDEDRREIVDALERVIAWLDDGFHERMVEELRGIIREMGSSCG